MKSFNFSVLLAAFMLIFNLNSAAQLLSTYTYTYTPTPYVPITGGTVLVSGISSWDDNVYTNIPVGFTFYFEGQPYTSVGVNSNGYIWFGTGTTNTNEYSPISHAVLGTGAVNGVVAAFANDLYAYGANLSYTPSGAPDISYVTNGTTGARIFTVQWKGANSHNDPGGARTFGYNDMERIDLQIKLYEGTNAISVLPHNMPFPYVGGFSGQVGLRGATNTDFQSLNISCSGTSWSNHAASQSINNAAVGVMNPCFPATSSMFTWNPGVNPCPAISITGETSTNACNGGLGSINITATGTGLLVYLIDNGTVADTNVNGNFSNLSAGTYTVRVTNGTCTQTGSSLTISSSSAITAGSNSPLCPGATLDLTAAFVSGVTYSWSGPASYSASTANATLANVAAANDGDYIVVATVPGCSPVSDTIHVVVDTCAPVLDTVWPGDANANGIASFQDMLSIAVAFGDVGPVRPSADNTWTAQPCPQWANTFSNGVNHNNADCNGDGVIDLNDTLPVLLNFGSTHSKTGAQRSPGSPVLGLKLASSQAQSGDDVTLDITLGDTSLYAYDVYGLTFAIAYDNTLIDAGSIAADFSHSWLGTAGNLLTAIKDDHINGQVDVVVSRIDHQNHSGLGPIGQIHFKTSQLPNGMTLAQLPLSITSYTAIDYTASEMPLDNKSDTLTIQGNVTGINNMQNANLLLYPNPALSKLSITSGQDIASYSIYNPEGQMVLHSDDVKSTTATIDIQTLSQGIYVLQATIGQQKVTRHFAVVR